MYEAVTAAAWKESQCCAWATFQVELPPDTGPIRWNLRSSRDEGVAIFDACEDLAEEFDGLSAEE